MKIVIIIYLLPTRGGPSLAKALSTSSLTYIEGKMIEIIKRKTTENKKSNIITSSLRTCNVDPLKVLKSPQNTE